jgi:hypothetical protein
LEAVAEDFDLQIGPAAKSNQQNRVGDQINLFLGQILSENNQLFPNQLFWVCLVIG